MTDARVFFGHTMEAMFVHAVPPAAFPELAGRYAEVGFDTSRPALPAYTYATWRACLRVQREVAFPNEREDDAAHQQGAHLANAYLHRTILGGPLKTLLRSMGAQKALERGTRNLRTGNNFSELRFSLSGPREGSLWVNDLLHDSPQFLIGALSRGMQLLGAHLDAHLVMVERGGALFSVKWGQGTTRPLPTARLPGR